MKALFYGSAVAAALGLLMGAALEAPLAVEDFEPMTEVAAVDTAEPPQPLAPSYIAPAAFTAISPVQPDYLEAEEEGPEPTPALYTIDPGDEPVGAEPVYQYAAAESDPGPRRMAPAAEPAVDPVVVDHIQGFGLTDETSAEPAF